MFALVALASCGGSNNDTDTAATTSAITATLASVATTAPVATAVPDTTATPDTTAAPTTAAPTTTSAPTTTAAPTIVHSLSGFDYHDMPALGNPNIRGTGCGSGQDGDPTLGDQLPDGIWYGTLGPIYEDYESAEGADYGYARIYESGVEIDLWCVYTGELGAQLFSECETVSRDCDYESRPDWYPEDNTNRLRSVPFADDWEFINQDSWRQYDGVECAEQPWDAPLAGSRRWPVWIAVNGGSLTGLLATCYLYAPLN
jgi:hypothetical protein